MTRFVARALVVVGIYVMALVLLPAAASAQATVTHDTFRTPFEFEGTNPCNGELVVFSGQLSTETTIVQHENGDLLFVGHQLITAQGEGSFGNHYSFADSSPSNFHFDSDSESFSQIIVNRVIGTGQAPSFTVTSINHLTTNANGEVTARVVQFKTECK